MKHLLLVLCLAVQAFAAGTVTTRVNVLGPGGGDPDLTARYVVVEMSWTGDSSDGTVPATTVNAQTLRPYLGFLPIAVQTKPGSPSPTNGYSLTVKDASGYDILSGGASSLSSTTSQSYATSAVTPPLQSTLTLTISGQSVASAKGTVYIFLQRPGLAPLALLKNQNGAGLIASVFGRTGAVSATSGDYTAGQVTNVAAGGIAATDVQSALNELDSEKLGVAAVGSGADGCLAYYPSAGQAVDDINSTVCRVKYNTTSHAVEYYDSSGTKTAELDADTGQYTTYGTASESILTDIGTPSAPSTAGTTAVYTKSGQVASRASGGSEVLYAAGDSSKAALSGDSATGFFPGGTIEVARLPAMVGDSGSGGTAGLVPAPSAGDAAAGKFLKADGTFAVPAGGVSAITPAFWPFGGMNIAGNSYSRTIGSANRVTYWAFTAQVPMTVTYINAYVAAGAGNLAVGLFDSSCNRLATSATLNAPGAATVRFTFSPAVSVSAGTVYLALTGDNTADKLYGAPVAWVADIANQGGSSSDYSYFYGANASTGTTTLTMPSSCGSRTSITSASESFPAVFIH